METTTPTASKKPIYKKWWFWVIAIFILAVIGSQSSKKKAAEPATSQSAGESAAPSALTVSARALFSAYEANEVSADNSYKDKDFYVTGTVKDIGKDILDRAYISLEVGNPIASVQCFVEDAQAVASVSKGQSVKIYGTGHGKLVNVFLEDCKIVN